MKLFVQIIISCILLTTVVLGQEIITLEKALEIAEENSPQIRHSQLQLERSRERLNAQNAALKSQFSLQLTPFNYAKYRRFNALISDWNQEELTQSSATFAVRQPVKWTDGQLELINSLTLQKSYSEFAQTAGLPGNIINIRETDPWRYENDLYLQFTQPLFTYNRTKMQLKELRLDLENTLLDYSLQQLSLEKQITQEFYSAYLQKQRLQIAIEEMNNRETSYNIIKNKVDAGISPMEELYQAELDLATSKSSVQNAEVALQNALDNFKLLIGVSIFEEIEVVTDVSHVEVAIDLDRAIEYGVENRLELRQRQIAIENSLFELTRTASENEFLGNLRLVYGLTGEDQVFNQVYQEPNDNQQVSLSFEIPLFDWGQKKSMINATQATIDAQRLNKEDTKNNIIFGIRQAYRAVKNQTLQIGIAQQNVRNAQLTYDINLERYKNGDLTSMDLSLFENQLSEKKIGYIEALINYKIALLDLKIQSLWDFTKSRPVFKEDDFGGDDF